MRQPSSRQQAASRANGAKSRGPNTAAGKRRSSRNGCKHNLFSRVAPMPPADDPDFIEHLADYRADFQPRTPEAESAVFSLAVNMWLRMHLWPVRKKMMDAEIRRQAALHPDLEPRFRLVLASDYPPLRQLERLDSRYGQRIFRAFKTLEREEKDVLRAERRRRAAPSGTRDFSRVPPAQQKRTPAAPKNDENQAPNLTAPGTRDFSRVPPAQPKRAPAASKNNEKEAPNLTRQAAGST
jgi:hypothetical protein